VIAALDELEAMVDPDESILADIAELNVDLDRLNVELEIKDTAQLA
jgi:hypothetical protein